MTISRFRIIDGGLTPSKPVPESAVVGRDRSEKWEHYRCGECSDELGFPFTQLQEVRLGAMTTKARGSAGELISATRWLACPRCHQLRFQIS